MQSIDAPATPPPLEVDHRPTTQSVQQMKYAVLWHQWEKSNSDLKQRAALFNHLKHHSAGRPVDRGQVMRRDDV